jgi:hypothetical protein
MCLTPDSQPTPRDPDSWRRFASLRPSFVSHVGSSAGFCVAVLPDYSNFGSLIMIDQYPLVIHTLAGREGQSHHGTSIIKYFT